MASLKSVGPPTSSVLPTAAQIDQLLNAQLIVAWAGEHGNEEEQRLGWWKSDLVSEFGGQDLFQRLLPQTWRWAMFQAALEAARREDRRVRRQDHDPDRLLSLFNLGFDVDERCEQRLQDLKRSGQAPEEVFPKLKSMLEAGWSEEAFLEWVIGHGKAEFTMVPAGRRLRGRMPSTLDEAIPRLVAALAPVDNGYPLPHFRREP